VARLTRPDGVELHYEIRGDGPLLAFAPYWSWTAGVYDEMLGDLAGDHRVLTYHLRGTGESTRSGPYEMATDTADLEALLEAAGGPAVVFALADASHRAVHLAAHRPDLVAAAICLGPPLPQAEFGSSEALVGSETVVGAFLEMLSRDYRGAIRSTMTMANPQLDQPAVQARVSAHVAFCPSEAAVGRAAAWIEDDPIAEALQIGDRLTVVSAQRGTASVWFPPPAELERITAEALPQARLVRTEDGPMSRPDETAAAIREVTARVALDA
jgi:pimeloyl-ACP methyl ester carboxylesterase